MPAKRTKSKPKIAQEARPKSEPLRGPAPGEAPESEKCSTAEKGYVTFEEALGFPIKPFPSPEIVGVPRNPAQLSKVDWNFASLIKKLEDGAEEKNQERVRLAALFHELARESASVREACAILSAPSAAVKKDMEGGMPDDEDWPDVQRYDDAWRYYQMIADSFPAELPSLDLRAIGQDRAWNTLSAEEVNRIVESKKELPEWDRDSARHRSLRYRDLPAKGPGWPLDEPIQFADERGADGWPTYHFNDGIPGRMILASMGEGPSERKVLSESLEICVCLNFRDDEIIDDFRRWLARRRDGLHEDLAQFREGGNHAVRLKADGVISALKALAALRLDAHHAKDGGRNAAAISFRQVYAPSKMRKQAEGINYSAPKEFRELLQSARKLGTDFLTGASLDSALHQGNAVK